jgi:hypothetical protein
MKKIYTLICLIVLTAYGCNKENNSSLNVAIAYADEALASGCVKTVVIINSAITANTTWDSCHYYYVQTNLNLTAKLTIKPGTVIKFNRTGAIQLNAGGVIKANGTANHRIVFTSDKDDFYGNDITGDGNTTPMPGDWNQVNLNGQSNSDFKYCIFRYGGYRGAGGVLTISANGQNTVVTNCRFQYILGDTSFNFAIAALDARGGGVGTIITNNSFVQNTLPLGVSTAFSLDNSNSFSKSHFQCIKVSNSFAPQQSISWSATTLPFAAEGSLGFVGDTLTLSPGVVLKFASPMYGLNLGDPDHCINHAAPGVRFTSIKDDYEGFDSNGDGSATSPHTGDWLGVFYNDSNRYFHWNNIKYAVPHQTGN